MALLDQLEDVADGGRGRGVLPRTAGPPPAHDIRAIRRQRRDSVLCLVRGGPVRPADGADIPGQPATTPRQLHSASPPGLHRQDTVDCTSLLH